MKGRDVGLKIELGFLMKLGVLVGRNEGNLSEEKLENFSSSLLFTHSPPLGKF